MFEKLQSAENRFQHLTELLSQPEVIADRDLFRKYAVERSELELLVECYRRLQRVQGELAQNKELLAETSDLELRTMALEEMEALKKQEEILNHELMVLLVPKDPNDEKNIIIEIRAGTGGDEAALFAGDLFSMYVRYAEARRWKVEMMSVSDASVGGYKEVIGRIVGKGAYSAFKYESGVHRVQRVPKTETQGRIHTSTVTVAVLPEAEEVEVEILDKDLRIDVFRSSGPGGQSVNTTDSAVRVTHIPSGLVVVCQDEKSQLKNKNKALTVLRARLLAKMQSEQEAERRDSRRAQIGTGERSERIRTYNFPQGRVTDHRIGLTLYQIDAIMLGKIDELLEALTEYYRAEALKGDSEEEMVASGGKGEGDEEEE